MPGETATITTPENLVVAPPVTTPTAPVGTPQNPPPVPNTENPPENVDDRIKREVQAALEADRKKFAETLGFTTPDEVAEAAKKHRAAVRESQDELTRTKGDLDNATTKLQALEAEVVELRLNMSLMEHLTKKHPDYVGREAWILPALRDAYKAAKTDEDREKAVEDVVKSFVKDNPIAQGQQQQQGSGPGPARSGGTGPTPSQQNARNIATQYVHGALGRSGLAVIRPRTNNQ